MHSIHPKKGNKTYTAWIDDANSKYSFDFNRININGVVYNIESYDPYALYDKFRAEDAYELVLKDCVKRATVKGDLDIELAFRSFKNEVKTTKEAERSIYRGYDSHDFPSLDDQDGPILEWQPSEVKREGRFSKKILFDLDGTVATDTPWKEEDVDGLSRWRPLVYFYGF